MAGIKGLKKGDRPNIEAEAEEFITGAGKRVKETGTTKRERVYERYTFSLTPDVSKDIDDMSYLPTNFRSSRSEVLKAAVLLLKSMDAKEIVEQLRKVKQLK